MIKVTIRKSELLKQFYRSFVLENAFYKNVRVQLEITAAAVSKNTKNM